MNTRTDGELDAEKEYLEVQIQQCQLLRSRPNTPLNRVIISARWEKTFEERLAEISKNKQRKHSTRKNLVRGDVVPS